MKANHQKYEICELVFSKGRIWNNKKPLQGTI